MGSVAGRGTPESSTSVRSGLTGRQFDEVVAAAARRERWAVDHLASHYLPRLTKFARNRGAADPGGIADVALFGVLNRLDELQFDVPEQLWAYLCLTARSRIIDAQRAARPVELVGEPGALDRGAAEPTVFDQQIVDRDYVADLLSPLTEEQRQVLELRFLQDLSIEQTANATGRSAGAVKGLQRRAINAIIAAVVIVLVAVLAFGAFTSSNRVSIELDSGPAGRVEDPTPVPDPLVVDEPPPEENGDADLPGEENGEVETISAERHTITVGTEGATDLDVSGEPVPLANHGARIYCAVSHFANGDPFGGATPGTGPAIVYWGNTAADATAASIDLGSEGRATCEGGVTNRSAYWAPALFDAADQVLLPETVLVEYKAFGGESFDRSTLRPIPAGLELLASAEIANHTDSSTRIDGDEETRIQFQFPSCVATDADGLPVLKADQVGDHLSYPAGNGGAANGCPSTHPYRIPTLSYTLVYGVGADQGWYLATADGSDDGRSFVAGAVSAWEPAAMEAMVACVRDLVGDCGFVGSSDSGEPIARGQLPERFLDPQGEAVYRNSVTLADGIDRTPIGTELWPYS